MKNCLFIFLFLTITAVAFGRLGDTQEVAKERYGESIQQRKRAYGSELYGDELEYIKDGYKFKLLFIDGICAEIEISMANGVMPFNEAEVFMEKNKASGRFAVVKDKMNLKKDEENIVSNFITRDCPLSDGRSASFNFLTGLLIIKNLATLQKKFDQQDEKQRLTSENKFKDKF